MRRIRGRFDIVVPLNGEAYMRLTSDKSRSLTKEEIVSELQWMIDRLTHKAPLPDPPQAQS